MLPEKRPNEEGRGEAKIFPVSKAAIEKALFSIAEDAHRASLEESVILETQNPHLNYYLSMPLGFMGMYSKDYLEGVLWTHRIIRVNAELQGVGLLKLSGALATTFMQDRLDRIEKLKELGGKSVIDDFAREWHELSVAEPELAQGIEEITRFNPYKKGFYSGAAQVVDALKRAEQGNDLAKTFTF